MQVPSMNAVTENWISIGAVKDIPLRGARRVVWGAAVIAVFRTAEERVHAIEDKCPHRNGPLSQGIVHDGCVTCPLHNWVISLETGEAQGADEGSVRVFRVRVGEAGEIFLSADDLKPAAEE
jgi:nitrite reductase (NADH) small subunit